MPRLLSEPDIRIRANVFPSDPFACIMTSVLHTDIR